MSGARILVALPFWVVAPWFGYAKGFSNRLKGVLSVFGFENLIFHLSATMYRGTVALNSKYLTIFDVREQERKKQNCNSGRQPHEQQES